MQIQETGYIPFLAACILLSFGLFGLAGLKGESKRWPLAGLSMLFGMLLGLVCAKVFYYLCQIDFMIAMGWKDTLFRLDPEELSFFGGAAGVCFGVALSARCLGRSPLDILNRFAPWGLLLGALIRFGEFFLDRLGIGPYLMDESLCFFPLGISFSYGDDWMEWYLAVFMLEGIALLAVAAASGLLMKEHRFIRSVFWMCLPQILLENLRLGSFMWFFCIRVEQLACMLAMFIILIFYGIRSKGQPRRFLAAGISLICAGLFIVCEFAMEGKIWALRYLNQEACYALMAAGLVVLGITEVFAFRKRMAAEGGEK